MVVSHSTGVKDVVILSPENGTGLTLSPDETLRLFPLHDPERSFKRREDFISSLMRKGHFLS